MQPCSGGAKNAAMLAENSVLDFLPKNQISTKVKAARAGPEMRLCSGGAKMLPCLFSAEHGAQSIGAYKLPCSLATRRRCYQRGASQQAGFMNASKSSPPNLDRTEH